MLGPERAGWGAFVFLRGQNRSSKHLPQDASEVDLPNGRAAQWDFSVELVSWSLIGAKTNLAIAQVEVIPARDEAQAPVSGCRAG